MAVPDLPDCAHRTGLTSGETPDAIGWQGQCSTLVECKASRPDFMADRQKWFRRDGFSGCGVNRYFLTPRGMVAVNELPERWGLLEVDGRRVRVARKSESFEANSRHEIRMLLSTLRRVGQHPLQGVSIRCFTMATKCVASLTLSENGWLNGQPTPADQLADPDDVQFHTFLTQCKVIKDATCHHPPSAS